MSEWPHHDWARVVRKIPSRHMTGTRSERCFGFRETLAMQAAAMEGGS